MSQPALQPGASVGNYTLIEPAGRGATAEVWKARDQRNGREVGLKLLADETALEDPQEVRERFCEEGRLARALRHPDIVVWLDGGEHMGRPWMALEWLPGDDLSHHIRRDALLKVTTVVQLARRLALALDHAHRQGIVHRDLKPANVRVDLARGVVKLADFGIAREEDSTRTRTGLFLGTPAYMAPELLTGATADARSDLYALGVLFFELLTGRRPIDSTSMGDLLRRLVREAAPDVRTLRPEVTDGVAFVLSSLLQREPARRPASGREVAEALQQATSGDGPASA